MQKKLLCAILPVVLSCGFALSSHAQMQSDNYQITTSVVSGGGAAMSSASYESNATLGQSSPLMDSSDPPYSANHDLYPGFWYTLEAGVAVCEDLASFAAAFGSVSTDSNYSSACDFDGDDDVDGSDLAEFAVWY